MGTLLRVLVIVITILTAASLFFAIENFNKRQILLGRTAAFEKTAQNVAKTLEAAEAPALDTKVLEKDTSEVSDRVPSVLEKDNLLENYLAKFETQNLPVLDFSSDDKRMQLRRYYAEETTDTGKIRYKKDVVTGQPTTEGAGTQKELLDTLESRAQAQRNTLNTTRAELEKMRERLTVNVDELNKLKGDSRLVKKELTEKKEEIVQLEDDKAKLESNVAKLTSEKKELQSELEDTQHQVSKLTDEKAAALDDLGKANSLVEELKEVIKRTRSEIPELNPLKAVALTAGIKGKVIESNDEFKFAIIEFLPEAMTEMMGEERENKLPQIQMNVSRSGRQSASGEFVTLVKLRQPIQGKNFVVADILSDWQQAPVEKGDVVYF